MQNGEIYTRQPETPSQPTQETPEDRKAQTEAGKPQESVEQLLAQIPEQVEAGEEQIPAAEIDHRDQKPDTKVVGLTAAPQTHPSPGISIPKAEESFQRQFGQNEGGATQRIIDALDQLQKAA